MIGGLWEGRAAVRLDVDADERSGAVGAQIEVTAVRTAAIQNGQRQYLSIINRVAGAGKLQLAAGRLADHVL